MNEPTNGEAGHGLGTEKNTEIGVGNPSFPVPCSVPDGWRLVPMIPTPKMISAAGCGWVIRNTELRKRLKVYRATIDAAPIFGDSLPPGDSPVLGGGL